MMMPTVETKGLVHRYGRVTALRGVDLTVPEGSVYGLIGPNGSGKTTLLQIVAGLRRPTAGSVTVLGREAGALTYVDRMSIGYIAEGQRLPRGMTLAGLEAYLAPLYDGWDAELADALRARFRLDPGRRLDTLSRGESMKAALLCTLAPRPELLVMDEPFTGMDVQVRDELVRGLLETSGREGWTVLVCSHDIGELEALIDHVGFLDDGRLVLSESMETVHSRFRWVDVVLPPGAEVKRAELPAEWLSVEQAGNRLRFLDAAADAAAAPELSSRCLPAGARTETSPATLRDVFLALAKRDVPAPRPAAGGRRLPAASFSGT